eukprot:scaffold47514_cov63-Phaeocystis_antarctica.AAC.2
MSGAPRAVRRPRLPMSRRRASPLVVSLNSSSACVCHLDVAALRRFRRRRGRRRQRMPRASPRVCCRPAACRRAGPARRAS